MDNNAAGSRKLFLKPAKSGLKTSEQTNENSSTENGSSLFSIGNNPFLRCENEKEELESKNDEKSTKEINTEVRAKDLFKPASTNLFKNATTLSENSNFVFGQNLHERVVIDKAPAISENENKSNEEKKGELLFSSALSQKPTEKITEKRADTNSSNTQAIPDVEDQSDENLSLIEAARRYEETKSAQKRKYEQVEVITGEEDDNNIIEMNCRLFTFDKNNWEERGRGTLRLNDCKNSARVVFRASGSLRLLLNTKVWKDQLCELANSKSLKLTAIDGSGLIKIYLVTGRIEDIENLYHALSVRIAREKDRTQIELSEKNEQDDEKTEETTEIDNASNTNDRDDDSLEPVSKKIATVAE